MEIFPPFAGHGKIMKNRRCFGVILVNWQPMYEKRSRGSCKGTFGWCSWRSLCRSNDDVDDDVYGDVDACFWAENYCLFSGNPILIVNHQYFGGVHHFHLIITRSSNPPSDIVSGLLNDSKFHQQNHWLYFLHRRLSLERSLMVFKRGLVMTHYSE